MGIIILIILFMLQCLVGFVLFVKACLNAQEGMPGGKGKVSVIIPARNEAHNLPHLLGSLQSQTFSPQEIIVVDDFSSDQTSEVAARYGVKVIQNTQLPDNWTGKNWALWNGFQQATGDILVFLDADVRLAPTALEQLLKAREKSGGAVSVVPSHHTERMYERLSLVAYLLGVFAFTSPFEKKNAKKGLYGSCIVAAR
nr:glycosyltransferase family A protein [Clostridia bacterium]